MYFLRQHNFNSDTQSFFASSAQIHALATATSGLVFEGSISIERIVNDRQNPAVMM
jgi:hypothetical protein